ncbi:MAG: Eco57I restriction-modification methylase domain-containing protein [Candidatus Melainabacteria bacterium]|nr:Eco57I restriction-modification methylase domain-containing protein [Candidatus Melainabacteria bacterium]
MQAIDTLITDFSNATLKTFLRNRASTFKPRTEERDLTSQEAETYENITLLGEIACSEIETIVVYSLKTLKPLHEKYNRKAQYETAKKHLRQSEGEPRAGLFVVYDADGCFRFSLVVAQYAGTKINYTTPKRYSFFVSPQESNKTFKQQLNDAKFSSVDGLLKAFSIEKVSDDFYKAFEPQFNALKNAIIGDATDDSEKEQFTIIFIIRILFVGFVQKKGWLGEKPQFLADFLKEYTSRFKGQNKFYSHWLKPLFFEALNTPFGRKVAYQQNDFLPETEVILQHAPYLNGQLFKPKQGVDTLGLTFPDEQISAFFEFLFTYNFTIEENTLYDEELELNPEFLGIIFERLVNKKFGAVYTPRPEVDFMCRMALLKWLEKTTPCSQHDLYHFFFREGGKGEAFDAVQKEGDFSTAEIETLITQLESVTVCDPAAGSGAFEVGMLQVLEELLQNLYARHNTPSARKTNKPTTYEMKRQIIGRSLYGVEVQPSAVWINHLRLWLSLFIEMPDEEKESLTPLLPNLQFKVCEGDSLVQRVGEKLFPVRGLQSELSPEIKQRIKALKEAKASFFFNQAEHKADKIKNEEVKLFDLLLQEEIDRLQNHFKDFTSEQLFIVQPIQTITPKEKAAIEAQIATLQEQKTTLQKGNLPFLWSVEFAEVFLDKGGFDIIIGNPPYVRNEEIQDPHGKLTPTAYKEQLKLVLQQDFPEAIKDKTVNGRSDLYCYFYVHTLNLLNPNGFQAFICSNSWLDVGYGVWLQEFLLATTPVEWIVDNHAKRSFANADVNTIISLIGSPVPPKKATALAQQTTKFVAFKQPFETSIITENLLAIAQATDRTKTEAYRLTAKTHASLKTEGTDAETHAYVGLKWGGVFLRSPDIYFTLMEKYGQHFTKIGTLANHIKRGCMTGADEFFFLKPLAPIGKDLTTKVSNASGWEGEIETAFLKPAIRNTRECTNFFLPPEDILQCLFVCTKSKSELKGTKALEYIEWGESVEINIKQGVNKGTLVKGYQSLSTTSNRKYWYNLGISNEYPLHFNFKIDQIGKCFIGKWLSSTNFYDLDIEESYGLSLNSSIFHLIQNVYGRSNFGGGLLEIKAYELKQMELPNVPFDGYKPLLQALQKGSIFEEYGLDKDLPFAQQSPNPTPARKAVDDVIFNALGLSQLERDEVYRAVCQLVWERTNKAKNKGA